MQYIHGHRNTHNLIDYSRVYSTNTYSQLLWSHLLNPVIPYNMRTDNQRKLYDQLEERMLCISDFNDTNNFPFLMHTGTIISSIPPYNISKVDPDWKYEDYKDLLESTVEVVWAIHPFTKHQQGQYERVCEEFGYQLERKEHPWNALDVYGLWNVVRQFNWRQHIANDYLDDVTNDLGNWYTDIFNTHYERSKYNKLIGLGPK